MDPEHLVSCSLDPSPLPTSKQNSSSRIYCISLRYLVTSSTHLGLGLPYHRFSYLASLYKRPVTMECFRSVHLIALFYIPLQSGVEWIFMRTCV
jgi:hypothetical protein